MNKKLKNMKLRILIMLFLNF